MENRETYIETLHILYIMFGRKYQSLAQIGQGKFGVVFKGVNIKTNESVAIKTVNPDNNSVINVLRHESTILNYLYTSGCRCIPIVYWYGLANDEYAMVIPLYQLSLTQIFSNKSDVRNRNIDKIDAIMLELLNGLMSIHRSGIIHRDIKPDNIMFADGAFFFIDFGFATSYSKQKSIPDRNTTLIGSPKYASINVHMGSEPNRRDDLISLGYVYLYMLFGELDWVSNTDIDIDIDKDIDKCNLLSPYLMKIAAAKSLDNITSFLILAKDKCKNMTKQFDYINKYLDVCCKLDITDSITIDHLFFTLTPMKMT